MLRVALLGGMVALVALAFARSGARPRRDALGSGCVAYGNSVGATGAVTPVEPGLNVTLEQESGGIWTTVATATTDATGAYSATFVPATSGPLRARLDAGEVSAESPLKVFPAVSLGFGKARAFLGVRLHASIRPNTYAGRLRISVRAGGRLLARTTARVLSGLVDKRIPTPWAGRVVVRITLPAADGLARRTITRRIWVAADSSDRFTRSRRARVAPPPRPAPRARPRDRHLLQRAHP
jgi:hypothetical protein